MQDLVSYTEYFTTVLQSLNENEINAVITLFDEIRSAKKNVFLIGNGGSASSASHFANDLQKIAGIRAISLCDNNAVIMAYANDDGYETVFAKQLQTLANERDCLVVISGSGNSPNLIKAIEIAHQKRMSVIALTGFDGGKVAESATHNIRVKLNDMCTSESAHMFIIHYLALSLHLPTVV